MTVAATIALLTSIFAAIPVLKEWFDKVVAAYVVMKVSQMKKENRDAIKTAIIDQDQREMEDALGSTRTGEASGLPGTTVVDSLPGVGMRKPWRN